MLVKCSIMAFECSNIKMEDTLSSPEFCVANPDSFNLSRVKVEAENEFISEEGGGTNYTESGMKEIKTEEADDDSEDVMMSSRNFVDVNVLTKEEDLGTCFVDLPEVKKEIENEFISREECQTNDTGTRIWEFNNDENYVLFPDALTSSAGSESLHTGSYQFVDTGALSKKNSDFCFKQNKVIKDDSDVCASIEDKKKLYTCRHCYARFKWQSDLKRHFLTHSNEKPFVCNQCSACFKEHGNLKRHLLIHSNEKPHVCNQCSACFKEHSNLKRHLLIHSNEKPHVCTHCSACFKDRSNLKTHLFTHSNEKPFVCAQCSACFKAKGTLKQHLLIHSNEKPHVCAQCSARFNRESCLRRHLLTH